MQHPRRPCPIHPRSASATAAPLINAVDRDFRDLYGEVLSALTRSERTAQPTLLPHGSDLVVAGRGRLQDLDPNLLTKELADRIEFMQIRTEGRGNAAQRVQRPQIRQERWPVPSPPGPCSPRASLGLSLNAHMRLPAVWACTATT